jgi:HK97 family phage prohead protease
MPSETRAAPPVIERRVVFTPADLRAAPSGDGGESRRVVGHAAVFDSWATLHDGPNLVVREVVRRGAFAEAIREKADVRALWNHDGNFPLARTANGTLTLTEDDAGLLAEFEVPDTQYHRDAVLAPIRAGLVTQMSFAFGVRKSGEVQRSKAPDGSVVADTGGDRVTTRRDGSRVIEERELLSLDLFDVSPVTYPAYEQTDVAVRSRCERREAKIRGRVLAERNKRKSDRLELMRMSLRLADARYRGGVS